MDLLNATLRETILVKKGVDIRTRGYSCVQYISLYPSDFETNKILVEILSNYPDVIAKALTGLYEIRIDDMNIILYRDGWKENFDDVYELDPIDLPNIIMKLVDMDYGLYVLDDYHNTSKYVIWDTSEAAEKDKEDRLSGREPVQLSENIEREINENEINSEYVSKMYSKIQNVMSSSLFDEETTYSERMKMIYMLEEYIAIVKKL